MLDKAIRSTTQEHLDIYTIRDHLVILKDGSVALVVQTSAINFDLLSDEEQDATTYAYAALLNSLSFSVQILIRSSRKDITSYIDLVDRKLEDTKSQKVREQIIKYRGFIKSLVKENQVLEKQFYIVIPFSSLEVGLKSNHLNPLAKQPQKPPYDIEYILEKAQTSLYPRRDHIIRQFSRIGLKSRQLTTSELVSLFFRIYNPEATEGQFFAQPSSYETFAVQTHKDQQDKLQEEKWSDAGKTTSQNNLLKPAYVPSAPTKNIPATTPIPQVKPAPTTPQVAPQVMTPKPVTYATSNTPVVPIQPPTQPVTQVMPPTPIPAPATQPQPVATPPTPQAVPPPQVVPVTQAIPTPAIPQPVSPVNNPMSTPANNFNPIPPPPNPIPNSPVTYPVNNARTETVIFSRPPSVSQQPNH